MLEAAFFLSSSENETFSLFCSFVKWKDKAATNWVIIVYDAVMMQQNIFQGEMHITKCCLSQQGGVALPDRYCKPVKSIFISLQAKISLLVKV